MPEEEKYEHSGWKPIGDFEGFVPPITTDLLDYPNLMPSVEPALKQQGYSPRPIKDIYIPLFNHRASMDQVDDKRKGIH